MSATRNHDQEHVDRVSLYALQALPADEVGAVEEQIAACAECREELGALRPVAESFVAWPTDVLRSPVALWDRVASRIGTEAAEAPMSPTARAVAELEWEKVAPGISVKLLATDAEKRRVSMLVRLEPGTNYPPHLHAGLEELHLLDGELWINERKLDPGDYNRAESGTADRRVFSETGCTCLLITSPDDILR